MSDIQNITVDLRLRNIVCRCCIRVIREDMERLGVKVLRADLNGVSIAYDPTKHSMSTIHGVLAGSGFVVIEDKELQVVQQIKTAVIELIHYAINANSLIRNSDYLVEKLEKPYPYLSSLFSKHEKITLEKYIILQKIEKVKELLEHGEYTLSEIAWQLEYSSVQYLSAQFKTITGISVTDYKKQNLSLRKPLDEVGLE
ncbi:MAG: AraC family transcriptional regulator [Bacteroidetes bacterium]|nr:AraC family transcriptional regulator [Bacteroidota bacterium]MBU1718308.1 AraC family transcriptional regulator [Bacteroidota bacterium]